MIYIGGDHHCEPFKSLIAAHLAKKGYETELFGSVNGEVVDYPDAAREICEKVLKTPNSLGILICGTGVGISIAANRYKGIRAALVYDMNSAEMSKKHNNANVVCVGEVMDKKLVLDMIDIFLKTKFEEGRHQRRIEKIEI